MSASSKAARNQPRLQHLRKAGADISVINRAHVCELHITLRPLPNERTTTMLWRLEALLREHEATIVRMELFGAAASHAEIVLRLRRLLRDNDLPITAIEGAGGGAEAISGIHVFAIAGATVEPLIVGGLPVGRSFDDGHSRHLLLGDVHPGDRDGSRADQARSVYDRIAEYAGCAGMNLRHLGRTWMFLDHILDWYGLFNAVRSGFYKAAGIFEGIVPASTGVGVANVHGAALVAAAWFIQPHDQSISVREVGSPLQCPAPQYGSSFSRALEVVTPEYRRLLISGTASIHRDGATARVGDIRGQIDLTMDVIQAILSANDFTFPATVRATAYFKDIRNAPHLDDWCRRNELLRLPFISAQADVCRDDLLFEFEMDAMAAVGLASVRPRSPRR